MNQIPFTNRYVTLGEKFYVKTRPSPVADPVLIKFNEALAGVMGLATDDLNSRDGAKLFSGNHVPEAADPLAMA